MGTALDTREAQASEVLDRLAKAYPDAGISLEFSTRLELLVAVVLSGQCTDERVNSVTPALFEKHDHPEDYVEAGAEALSADISSITYPNQKAGWIVDACEQIVEDHDGSVPGTMGALTDLPGVGRKTANVVLQHGHDVVEGIAVDTHAGRLSRRLGLTEQTDPEAAERDLVDVVPEDRWRVYTHLLIAHGRATCTARNPDCGDCVLADVCPSERGDSSVDLATGEPWE
ncbi:MAG: DNA lyase/endonuclease III [uncultured archaeon A07HB70]|nr:MAG: DNA lyase/endonuclease III [uncultured archaeon A07HB70]